MQGLLAANSHLFLIFYIFLHQ